MANTMARSFLQVAAAEEVAPPLRVVQIEGLVMLKIIKHCKEFSPALVTGQLLGLDVGSVLEVTNCFPFPIQEEDEEIEADGANYQLEMMRCLREVNVDNNTVGWYQSTMLGCFQTAELIETFLNYQENIRRCVCIIYDPSRSNQGALAFKALKLSDSFMDLYRSNNFTGEKLREKNLSWVDIFEEIPVKVSNSALISAFMTELEPDTPVTQRDYDRLQLSSSPFLERNMEFLIECMDDLSVEQQKFQFYYRSLTRQQAQQQSWLQKRRDENKARKAAGEEPLPEEDPSNPIFKPIPEPPRLESFLIANRIANYCNQINGKFFDKARDCFQKGFRKRLRDSDGPTLTYSQHPSRMTETTILFCYWNFVSSISSREREREDVLDLVSSTPMSHSVWIHATNS
ncbi:eukaryotic translation initiation factor 3 subunit H [Citrus sinensis]|uniref:Eukaryotic translation initiation factor 3 subunit H n=1 Tax=Citrus sinensis TaxID=2711 RepID=A0ACB8HZ64_CITSI|nr:eukaryotic translation initiation factor 3 subunit H [Citrus sinensis]